MKPRITLELPLPPSTNNLHGVHGLAGERYLGEPKKKAGTVFRQGHYVRWIKQAGLEFIAVRPKMPLRALPPGPYCARILWPAGMALDGDNPVKPLIDFLHYMRVTPDDSLLWHHSATRARYIEPGRCRVTVWSLR